MGQPGLGLRIQLGGAAGRENVRWENRFEGRLEELPKGGRGEE